MMVGHYDIASSTHLYSIAMIAGRGSERPLPSDDACDVATM